MSKQYIISGNAYEFNAYVNKIGDFLITQHVYVNSVDSIRGLTEITGRFVGTWYERDDIFDIVSRICYIKAKPGHQIVGSKNYELLLAKLRK